MGVMPTLLLFQQPFGINALVGLIALSGILMRNTLILIGQIRSNEKDGLAPFDAVVEATVQRSAGVVRHLVPRSSRSRRASTPLARFEAEPVPALETSFERYQVHLLSS